MHKGLIEINPGSITWYKLSLSSTLIEILGTKEIKIKKILNFPYRDEDLYYYENIIETAKHELDCKEQSDLEIISVSNFPSMFIARLGENNDIKRINDSRWLDIVRRHIENGSLNIWFEKGYAKIAWISNGIPVVQNFPINQGFYKSKISLLKDVSKFIALYDVVNNVERINIGGQFNSRDDDYISCAILIFSRLYPYAKISYDLPSFIEIYTGLKLKSYT